MKTRFNIHKDRQTILPNLTFFIHSAILVETLLILSSLPVFYSCSHYDSPMIADHVICEGMTKSPLLSIDIPRSLMKEGSVFDIFFFRDDILSYLDSYQRIIWDGDGSLEASSTTGARRVVVIANSPFTQEECMKIRVYEDISSLQCDLAEDSPDTPVMFGESRLDSNAESKCYLRLHPVMSEIRLASISCDFHDRGYCGETLDSVKFYLTNVCCLYPVCDTIAADPHGMLNIGGLNKADMASVSDSSILYHEYGGRIGLAVAYPEVRFYCYGNAAMGEGVGTRRTRLVVEGVLLGKRYWYPVTVGEDKGIYPGCSYVYDLTITRAGTDDPDSPADIVVARRRFSVKPWAEVAERIIPFSLTICKP